jgi:hypothetical protein
VSSLRLALCATLLLAGCATSRFCADAVIRAGAMIGSTEQSGSITTPVLGADASLRYRRAGIGLSFDYAEDPQILNAWHFDLQYHHPLRAGDARFAIGSSAVCFSAADCDSPVTLSAAFAPNRWNRRAVVSARYVPFDTANRKDPLTGRAVILSIGLAFSSHDRD